MGAKVLCVLLLVFVLLSLAFCLHFGRHDGWFPTGMWFFVLGGMILLSLLVDRRAGMMSALRCIFKQEEPQVCVKGAAAIGRASDYSTVLVALAALLFCFYVISAAPELLSWDETPRWRALQNGFYLLLSMLFTLVLGRFFLGPLQVRLSIKDRTLRSALTRQGHRDLLVVVASVGLALFMLVFSMSLGLDVLPHWREALPQVPEKLRWVFTPYGAMFRYRVWPIVWFVLITWASFSFRVIGRALRALYRVLPDSQQSLDESKAFFRVAASNALLIGSFLGIWEMAYGLMHMPFSWERYVPALWWLSPVFGWGVWKFWPPMLLGTSAFVFLHLLRLMVAIKARRLTRP